MPMASNLLPDTVGLRRLSGHDEYGKPAHDSAVSYQRSRNIQTEKFVQLPGGEVIMRAGQVVFGLAPDAEAGDLVVLPDGSEHTVLLRRYGRDGSGARRYTAVDYR